MNFLLDAAVCASVGYRRRNNEDNFYFAGTVLPEENRGQEEPLAMGGELDCPVTFGVFDGMGGEKDGQTASFMAAEVCSRYAADRLNRKETSPARFLSDMVAEMNAKVAKEAGSRAERMGTTAVILYFENEEIRVCNVGDSRAFRIRKGVLQQISKDHTDAELLNKLGVTGRKPSLSQYIGLDPEELTVEPFLAKAPLKDGDRFLICSDGLTDMVSNEEILAVIEKNSSCGETVRELVQTALLHGGRDNVTVLLAHTYLADNI